MSKQKQELKLLNISYLCSKSTKKDCDRTERFNAVLDKVLRENDDALRRLADK